MVGPGAGVVIVGLLAALPVGVGVDSMITYCGGSGGVRVAICGEQRSVTLAEHVVMAARQFCGEQSVVGNENCGVDIVDDDEVLVGVGVGEGVGRGVLSVWLFELIDLPPPLV